MRRAALILAVVTACGGPLDHKQLHGEVQDLHALAAEARLLFMTDVPDHYFKAHRQALADKVKAATHKLERGVDDASLDADRKTAYVLGRALEPIVRTGTNGDQIQPIEHQLAAIDTRLAP